MKAATFELLKRAALNDVDKTALLQAKSQETDPFVHDIIDVTLGFQYPRISWDSTPFTTQFRSVPARQRLDETVITFLLRIASILKSEMLWRAFGKPQSQDVVVAWSYVLKHCIFSIFALLYDTQWSIESLFQLDATILKLMSDGKSNTLREFMRDHLKIPLASDQIYPAETMFEKLYRLNVVDFGSFFWRLLHWMAEAMDMKRNPFAKAVWRDMLTGSLNRTLLCGICMLHLREFVTEHKSTIMDDNISQAHLWFKIHNQVHQTRRRMNPAIKDNDYTEAEYEKDSEYMHQVLK